MIALSLDTNLDFSCPAYRELFECSNATAFQHPLWLSTLHETLLEPRNADQMTVVGHDSKTGRLVLVLPLVRRRKLGTTIVEFADFGVTDYCAPVVRKGYENEITTNQGMAVELRRLVGHCDVFRLKAVRPEHVRLVDALTGLTPQPTGTCSHELTIGTPFDEWRCKTYSKSHLRQIDGSCRRIKRLGDVRFERLTDGNEAKSAIGELRSFRAGRFEGDPIAEDCVFRFYSEIAARGASDGFAQVHRITLDKETVGIDLGIAQSGRFHGILIGCEYDQYRRCSPGYLMYDMILADWAKFGGRILDFNVGDCSYKEKFGTTAIPVTRYSTALTVTGQVADRALSLKKRLRSTIHRPRGAMSSPKRQRATA